MHKITFLASLLMFIGIAAFAQENRSALINAKIKDGTVMIGGSLGGTYQKYKSDNRITKTKETGDLITGRLLAKGGYFFLPDFVVGINAEVQHVSINVDSTRYGDRKTTDLLAGPYVRYYLNNGLFGEFNVNAGVRNIKGGDKFDIKTGAIGIGYAYFLNEVIAIEPVLSFNYEQSIVDNAGRNTKDSSYGPRLNIGIQAYLWAPTRVLPTK